MTYSMEDVLEIIRTKNWNAASSIILSCREFLQRSGSLKEIHGKDNIHGYTSTNFNSVYSSVIKDFKKGFRLDSLCIPGFKDEPRTGNFRAIMINDGDSIPVEFEESRRAIPVAFIERM